MKTIRLNDITDKVFALHKLGNKPGVKTGYNNLDQHYTVKKGHTTIISGYPTAGKTQFTVQLLCNLTNLHQFRHVIYSPETGNAEEIFSEIIHCLTGKTFNKTYDNYISESEIYKIQPFVSDYFIVIEPSENNATLEGWYTEVDFLLSNYEIDTITVDNWNDLEHDMSKFGGKISEYLKYQLPRFNRFCKTYNVHGFLLAHPRNPDPVKGQDALAAPRPDMLEGGSLWWAKAQSLLILHRDLSDPESRTTQVIISKVKPKIVGRRGVINLDFSPRQNCYYEVNNGLSIYPISPFKEQNISQPAIAFSHEPAPF